MDRTVRVEDALAGGFQATASERFVSGSVLRGRAQSTTDDAGATSTHSIRIARGESHVESRTSDLVAGIDLGSDTCCMNIILYTVRASAEDLFSRSAVLLSVEHQ